jgi:hypothetical protein
VKIDWISKLQHLLQTLAFCLAVAAIQVIFQPERPYAPPMAYSISIGLFIWAIIDLGRHLFPSASETGWPTGWAGLALVAGGIVAGYFLGNALADLFCRTFGWYAGAAPLDRRVELRNSVLITALAGVTGSYYFYTVNKSAYLERKMAEAQRLANESRLKLLEAQLEPHMLFNTLANLRALVASDPPRAQTMIDHLVAFLRSTLDASRATQHALKDEFERTRDYLELIAIRMGPRLRFSLELPNGLEAQLVPTLLLQALVENAILHGLEPKIEGGSVAVRARLEAGQIVMEVIDSGVGLTQASHSKGFGLSQVRERLRSAYGAAATFAIQNNPNGAPGVSATVRIPVLPAASLP